MAYRLVPALIIAAAAISGPAFADARDDVLAGVARCGTYTDHRIWLDCFYGAAQPLRTELGLSPAPASQTGLVTLGGGNIAAPSAGGSAPRPVAPRPEGGVAHFLLGGDTLANKAPIASYSFDSNGHFTITMTDGDVWQQVPTDTTLAHWDKPFARYRVSITQGQAASYNLTVENETVFYKVRRIQ